MTPFSYPCFIIMSMGAVMMYGGLREHFRKPLNCKNMPERKNPATSLSAYKNLHQSQKDAHYAKIIEALKILGSGTADGIAQYLGMEHVQINRRMIELERDQKIYKSGEKKKTRRGHDAFVWYLCDTSQPKIEKQKAQSINPKQTTISNKKQIELSLF